VDLFKGFQHEPKEPFWPRIWNNPETERSVDPAEVEGVCIKWYQRRFLFVDFRQKKKRRPLLRSQTKERW
jgi:hypothetical protein